MVCADPNLANFVKCGMRCSKQLPKNRTVRLAEKLHPERSSRNTGQRRQLFLR
jgi:hypothetical protein